MAITLTADESRMLVAGQKEIFMRNFDEFPLEYPEFTTHKSSQKQTETYDSVGNLKAATQTAEGDAIQYGKVTQAYQTSVTNLKWTNGYAFSIEAIKYDLYGFVNSVKAKELSRTMRENEETRAALRFNNAFTSNLADGVPLCSASKPLHDVSGKFNSTLGSGALTPDNVKSAINQFAQFLNHQGGQMKSIPTDLVTHAINQFTVEEILQSGNKAYEFSNTKNVLPRLRAHYSHYFSDTNNDQWFIYDDTFEHVIFQQFEGISMNHYTDTQNTLSEYFNAVEFFETAALPNIGIVGSSGA